MSEFESMHALVARFQALGAKRIFFKALSENDNSKQQIYLGGSFEVLTFFPYGDVTANSDLKDPTFKAQLQFWWVTPEETGPAPNAKLILYPRYPEVRLSGFLLGAPLSPSNHLQPIPKDKRRGFDGRVLFMGTTEDGRTLAYLAPASTPLALEALEARAKQIDNELFIELPLPDTVAGDSKQSVIAAIRAIQDRGFVASVRIKSGQVVPYSARNGGGYTLEALLGIAPNGKADPDYLGWEIKAFSGGRITLMTPEPDKGFYGEQGVGVFVRRYGRYDQLKDRSYFTGVHRFGATRPDTGMTLGLAGYDCSTGKISDVNGSILLLDRNEELAAAWSFSSLLTHWNRKHASAAYVPYVSDRDAIRYRYTNPILMGEQTDFSRYLAAIAAGAVYYDPGSKVEAISSKPKVKARSQFRIGPANLPMLYRHFEKIDCQG